MYVRLNDEKKTNRVVSSLFPWFTFNAGSESTVRVLIKMKMYIADNDDAQFFVLFSCFIAAVDVIRLWFENGIIRCFTLHQLAAPSLLYLNGRALVMDIVSLNKHFCSLFCFHFSPQPAEDDGWVDFYVNAEVNSSTWQPSALCVLGTAYLSWPWIFSYIFHACLLICSAHLNGLWISVPNPMQIYIGQFNVYYGVRVDNTNRPISWSFLRASRCEVKRETTRIDADNKLDALVSNARCH